MNLVVSLLLALVLLLSPILAAIPDEPLWSSWLSAGTLLAVVLAAIAALRGNRIFSVRLNGAEKTFLVLLGLAFLSIPARLVIQHGADFFGLMLRGWAILATDFALFALARRVAVDKRSLYGLILSAVVGAAYVSQNGVLEYLPFLMAHQTSHRVFSTSTPDYLAGYLVLLLPVTLALLLQVPAASGLPPLVRRAGALILGLIFLFEMVALLTTGSRFALVSLLIGFAVFGVSLLIAMRHGLTLSNTTRGLLGVMLVGLILAGAVFARPVIARLHNVHDNSAAFRKWTWKGSLKMAAANPALGTGIGTWPDLYPRYALTGFTRLAHNSYLQMADECGIPALLALLTTLGLLGRSVSRGLSFAPTAPVEIPAALTPRRGRKTPAPAAPPPIDILPNDPRLLLCGLAGALTSGAVQNLIDSDWSVFFLGATFWTLAGLAAGVATPTALDSDKQYAPLPISFAVGTVAAALCVFTAAQGIAAGYGSQDYGAARAWDPLNGKNASDQGYKVFFIRNGDLPGAETALRTAVALEPNSLNYKRLGTVLQRGGRQREAQEVYRTGLEIDPNNLDLLLALGDYRRLSDLEMTPVGTVRALGEVTETKFAVADAAMGDAAVETNPAEAADYYARAAKVLEAFADEGGSTDFERQALSGGHADPQLDRDMRSLYRRVLDHWIALAPDDATLPKRSQEYLTKFDAVLAKSAQ